MTIELRTYKTKPGKRSEFIEVSDASCFDSTVHIDYFARAFVVSFP